MSSKCPCLSNRLYSDCCMPFHQGLAAAPTPEHLMRSRYSAFSLHDAPYLIRTHLPEARSDNELIDLEHGFKQTRWVGLRVIKAQQNRLEGYVEFVAFYRAESDAIKQIHELSRFKQVDNLWYYCDGQFLPDIKLQRNEACICGSGKKTKKCCGN